MRVALHCHAGPQQGSGHLIRCLALAQEAARRGHDPVLVGHLEDLPLLTGIGLDQVEVVRLSSAEPDVAARALTSLVPDLVHIDLYADAPPAEGWLVSNMRDGDFGARPADVVIDPTPGARPRPQDAGSTLLLGPQFAPLRPAIAALRGAWHWKGNHRILVTMGSTDPMGLTSEVLRIVSQAGISAQVTVLGARPGEDVLTSMPVVYQSLVPDFGDVVLGHDMVISASGTTAMELACLGVPMVLVCAVPNQLPAYQHLVQSGVGLPLGTPPIWEPEGPAKLHEVWTSPDARSALSAASADLVDGKGTIRIVEAWEALMQGPARRYRSGDWLLRSAGLADAGILLAWRNDLGSRNNSRTPTPVTSEEHAAWLTASIERPDRWLMIAEHGGRPCGTIRWDSRGGGVWEVSITIAPEVRGQGIGGRLLTLGEAALTREGNATTASAAVRLGNTPSIRLFLGQGYELVEGPDPSGFLRYEKRLVR